MKDYFNKPLRSGLSAMSSASVLIIIIAVGVLLFTTTAFAVCDIQSEQTPKLVWSQQLGSQKIRHLVGGHLQLRGGWVNQDRRRVSITTKKDKSGFYLEEAELRYFEFGAEDGAEDALEVGGDMVAPGTGLYDGDFTKYLNEQATFGNASLAPNVANDSDDNIKLSYYTPRTAGLMFGVSYTPTVKKKGVTGQRGNFYNHVGVGANYLREFGGGNNFKASATLSHAKYERKEKAFLLDIVPPDVNKERSLHAAASLALGKFEFSVNAALLGDGGLEENSKEDNGWNTGAIVAYNYGPGKIGVGAAYAEATNALGKDDKVTYLGLAADYNLNEYIKFVADIHHIDSDRNDALILVAGTEVSF